MHFQFDFQLAANAFHFLAANLIGLIDFIVTDVNQRKAFMETREALSVKISLEQQNKEQVSLYCRSSNTPFVPKFIIIFAFLSSLFISFNKFTNLVKVLLHSICWLINNFLPWNCEYGALLCKVVEVPYHLLVFAFLVHSFIIFGKIYISNLYHYSPNLSFLAEIAVVSAARTLSKQNHQGHEKRWSTSWRGFWISWDLHRPARLVQVETFPLWRRDRRWDSLCSALLIERLRFLNRLLIIR